MRKPKKLPQRTSTHDVDAGASRRVYTIPEAGLMAGLGRNKSYDAAKRGEIPTIKFGRLRKVPAVAWDLKLRG